MMSRPLVSIIVPVFNGEKFIGETVWSILSQSYENIECIVVDDGSSDGTIGALEEFHDQIILLRQSNQGQASAINAGFSVSNGQLLSYLSADDLLDLNCIQTLVDYYLRASPNLPHVIFPQYRTIDSQGNVLNSRMALFKGSKHMLTNFKCLIGPGAIFSRSLYESFGGWDPSYKQIPDYVFWLKLVAQACFVQIEETMASFRVHSASQTFAQSDRTKSDESIRFCAEFSKNNSTNFTTKDLNFFRSSAYNYSSCLHFRAGRYSVGLHRFISSIRISPSKAFSVVSVRSILSNIVASFRYFHSNDSPDKFH